MKSNLLIPEGISHGKTAPAAIKTTTGTEFDGGLPVKGEVDGGVVEFIVKTQNAIHAKIRAIAIFGIVEPNVGAGSDIPAKATGIAYITMDFI